MQIRKSHLNSPNISPFLMINPVVLLLCQSLVSGFSYQKVLKFQLMLGPSHFRSYFHPFSSRHPSEGKRKPRTGGQAAIEGGNVAAATAEREGKAQQVQLPPETTTGGHPAERARYCREIQGQTRHKFHGCRNMWIMHLKWNYGPKRAHRLVRPVWPVFPFLV